MGEAEVKVLESAGSIRLPDRHVAVVGDLHGNVDWARSLARALSLLAPDVTTMLQLGDWQMPPVATDEIFAETGIERIYVPLGNHERWNEITPALERHPGAAVRVSKITWLLPRPARLTIGDRRILSLGGAASVDRASRTEGLTWWPDEAITDEHVAAAIAGGPADLMLTHESPASTPVRPVQKILRTNPSRFPQSALHASAASRSRVSEVWDAARPELLMHGHLHVAGGGKTEDGRRVASFGRDTREGNLGILDLSTLKIATPSLAVIRGMAARWEDDCSERERRMNSVAEALHSGVLDGKKPSPAALQDARDYINGRRTLDELIEDVRRRHTRPREDET